MPKQSAGGEQTPGLHQTPRQTQQKRAPGEERSCYTTGATINIHFGNLVGGLENICTTFSAKSIRCLSQIICTKTPTRGFINRERSIAHLQSALFANQV